MAASTLTNLATSLKRIYSDETFEYAQNFAAPLVALLDEVRDLQPEGAGFFWPFMLRSPQNIGTPAEDGNVPAVKQRTEIQGQVNAGQFVGTFEISFMLEAAGTLRGTWNKSEVKKHSWETLTDLVKHRNRIYSSSHGTKRLAQVNANTTTVNTFVGKLPYGTLLLRPNMLIDIYDADSGGASVILDRKITSIVGSTRTVTFDGAAASLTANDHVYISKSYGVNPINGLPGLIDDGTNSDLIHGQSRTTYPELKASVYANGGTPRALTEDLILLALLDQRQRNGGGIDVLVMNTGIFHKFLVLIRPERHVVVGPGGGKAPGFKTLGWNSEDEYVFYGDGRRIRIIVSEDVKPRTIYGINLSQMRRVLLKKLGWKDHGGGSIFIQGADSGGLKTTNQATMYSLENLATYRPDAHIRIDDLSDLQLAGAGVGGSDT